MAKHLMTVLAAAVLLMGLAACQPQPSGRDPWRRGGRRALKAPATRSSAALLAE